MSTINFDDDGTATLVTKEPDCYLHRNLTPGAGACTFCKGPLDADADMVAKICTPCWDKMFEEDDEEE